MLSFMSSIYAQHADRLPHFRIGRTDRTYFDERQLRITKPVLLIYFLPDCEDCQGFTKALVSNIGAFKNIQIVMVTNSSLSQLIKFENEFRLRQFKNLIAGTESYTMVLQRALNVQSFPFIVCYDQSGKLLKRFSGKFDPWQLLKKIKLVYK